MKNLDTVKQEYVNELSREGKNAWHRLHKQFPKRCYFYLIFSQPELRNQLSTAELCWYAKQDEKAAVYLCRDLELPRQLTAWSLLNVGKSSPKAARALLENSVALEVLGNGLIKQLEEYLNKTSPIDVLPNQFLSRRVNLQSSSDESTPPVDTLSAISPTTTLSSTAKHNCSSDESSLDQQNTLLSLK